MREFRFESVERRRTSRTILVRGVYFPPGRTYSRGRVGRQVNIAPRLFLITMSGAAKGLTKFLGKVTASRRGFQSRFFASTSLGGPGKGGIVVLNLSMLPRCQKRNLTQRVMEYCLQERRRGKEGRVILAYLSKGMRVCGEFKFMSLKVSSSI